MRFRLVVVASAALVSVALAGCSSSSSHRSGPSSPSTSATPPASAASTATSAPPSGASTGSVTPPRSSSSSGSGTVAGPSGGPVPDGFVPTSATFISSDAGWVLGTAPCSSAPCTSIVRTRDGGRSWQGIPAPRASLGGPGGTVDGAVSVLRFATASDGWAGADSLYSTHDGGASWHLQHVGSSGQVVKAIATGGGYVYVTVGCPITGDSGCVPSLSLYASPIGSDHWTSVVHGVGGRVVADTIVVHGGQWYVSTTQGIYHGAGTGSVARLANPCPEQFGSRSTPVIAVADSAHLDAMCGGDGAAGSARFQLYGTSNGGATWQKAGPAREEPSDLNAIADNTRGVLLASASSGDSRILRTADDGAHLGTSLSTSTDGGREWADLGFTTPSQAVVVLPNAAMYLSHDAGASFVRVSF